MRTVSGLAAATAMLLFLASARADVPPGTAFVESQSLPVRVYYSGGAPQTQAEALLVELEKAWAVEITELGFATPLRVVDGAIVPGFNLHVTRTDPHVGYTFEVLGDNPATPEADCPLIGVVNKDYLKSQIYFQDAAWHVLNHASLHAVDCLERSVPTNDIFSVGLQHLRSAVPPAYFKWENEAFQSHPEYPLDAVGFEEADMFYPFGAALYAVFLEERFGQGDGKLLAEIWRHTAQPGHVVAVDAQNAEMVTGDVVNSPTWFDAIEATLAAQGSSFAAAYQEFAVWRLLVGPHADGRHFKEAAKYAAPALARSLTAADLPVANARPTKKVGSWGTSYVVLDPAGVAPGQAVRVMFGGVKPFRWAAQTVCLPATAGEEAQVRPLALNATSMGTAYVDPAGCRAIALVVENLSDGAYVPDDFNWGLDGDYVYSFALSPLPTITSVAPEVLLPGTEPTVTVRGTRLLGPSLTASLSGAGLEVVRVEGVDETTVRLALKVAADAPVGPRDLTLTSSAGLSAQALGALRVEVPPDAGQPGADAAAAPGADAAQPGADAAGAAPEPSAGCGCGAAAGSPSLLLALLGLGWTRRTRRQDR